MGLINMKRYIIRIAGKKQPAEKETGHKSPPKGYPKSKIEYADPKNYKYPINTKDRVMAAWRYINMPRNQKQYTSADLSYIKNKIKNAGKKFGLSSREKKKND